jgi:membrane protease YdiL (CAAX protease family)
MARKAAPADEARKSKKAPAPEGYLLRTRRPLYSLAFVLPMVLFYELGMLLVMPTIVATRGVPARLSSDELMRELMREVFLRLGLGGAVMSGLLVAATLLVWQIISRRPWELRLGTLCGMLGEAMILAVLLIGAVKVAGEFLPMTIEDEDTLLLRNPLLAEMVIGVGAGVYEEFVFRLALVPLFALVLSGVTGLKWKWGAAAGVVLSAVIFAAAHHLGPLAWAFTWRAFLSRSACGIFFGTVYCSRGFGVAAGSHALYDVGVILMGHFGVL